MKILCGKSHPKHLGKTEVCQKKKKKKKKKGQIYEVVKLGPSN